MEGWPGFDNLHSEIPYFRRLASTDSRWMAVCVGSAAELGGAHSFRCGVFPGEGFALCYAAGTAHGNAWKLCIQHQDDNTSPGGGE